jgi:nitrite reductase (NADH) small subunit
VVDAPAAGKVGQYEAAGVDVCVSNVGGELRAMDNWCPHRHGPLGEGWLEEGRVVCPWHAWGFDTATGDCAEERAHVAVFPVKVDGDDVLVDIT